jgi:hypothetical protein
MSVLKVEELDLSSSPLLGYLSLSAVQSREQLLDLLSDIVGSTVEDLDESLWQQLRVGGHDVHAVMLHLLLGIAEEEWRDPWVDVVTALLSAAPYLTLLKLNKCIRRRWQMLVLIIGVVRAAQVNRRVIAVRGCTDGYEDIIQAAHAILAEAKLLGDGRADSAVVTVEISKSSICLPSLIDWP